MCFRNLDAVLDAKTLVYYSAGSFRIGKYMKPRFFARSCIANPSLSDFAFALKLASEP